MTPEQLRASILQQAMEGKLVKQNPNDEPASVLLEKIGEEKASLIKEKKIKRTKQLPEITDDEKPFEIPDSWKWVRMSDVLDVRDGTHDSPKYIDNGIPLITSKNISNGYLDFSNVKYISQEDADKINERSSVDDNDIIFAMIGTIGNPIIIKKDREFAIKNVALLKHFSERVYMPFILQYMWVLQAQFNENASGAVQKFVSLKKIRQSLIPLPPLAEQKRIVVKLDQIMPLVDEYAEAYDKLKKLDDGFNDKLKQSLLQYAMEGKLVKQDPNDEPASVLLEKIAEEKARLIREKKIKRTKKLPEITDDEKPFEIPDSWEWIRLGNLVRFTLGKTPKRSMPEYWESGTIPWVSISDLNNATLKQTKEHITPKAYSEVFGETISTAGTMLMSFKLTIGKVSILGIDAVHNEAIISIYPYIDANKIIRDYLYKVLPFISQHGDFNTAIKGKTLNKKSLSNLLIPLPPLAEQKRIVAKLDQLMSTIH